MLPAAQFAYRKVLACTYALLKSLDAGMESYIVQLDFSAAFNKVNHMHWSLIEIEMY